MEAMDYGFRTEPCFVCRMVAGEVRLPESIIYEDDRALVFLDGYPRAYSYTLVAPKEHKEQVTADFAMEEYLGLQELLYRVTEAVREEVGAERMYIYTYGSNQGNAHVHWHVVPLPHGVPYEDQQGPGRVGARACSRYLPRIWLLWQDVSTAGSKSSTQPRG